MKEKVVLAYSGGLDTTALIPWLKETFDYDVVCCCVNCGQGNELMNSVMTSSFHVYRQVLYTNTNISLVHPWPVRQSLRN